ncbi:MAG: MBL fold metallo-hydrolase [Myxococcales bacterium]|nr:MBL fold metallo-hydrolase [Myxococcales bacterium]MCB9737361.1 MBL fold metallo-hydrolase [Deltaproteobacteria bacterium]
MHIKHFYDPATYTLTFVVFDEKTRDAVVIDPVLDYDPIASATATRSVEEVEAFLKEEGLSLRFVLETHAHADHLSGSLHLKRRFDARVAIGARITEVQETFAGLFAFGGDFKTDGSQFDVLVKHGDVLDAGAIQVEVIETPGHTPACVSYLIGDALFTGDALFIEDYGTGRCDFPRGDAKALYHSIMDRLYKLPDATRVFVGHDYQPNGRELRWETTIGASKAKNIQLRAETPEAEYVAFRQGRDKTLAAPRLLFPSIQVNIDAGRLPAAAANGIRYLRVPMNLKSPTDEDGTPRA